MLKYLLLGRTGSGREFFQKLLLENKISVARSFTTRPPCNETVFEDSSHCYITDKQMNEISNRVLETEHNGYRYCYTRTLLECSLVIPIDPENVKTICEMFPDTAFRFIEIVASNEDRIKHAVADAEDKLTAEEDFIAACEEENEAFCKFEDIITEQTLGIDNLMAGHVINNDFTSDSDVYGFIENITNSYRVFTKMLKIIDTLREHDILTYSTETNTYTLCMEDKNTGEPYNIQLSADNMAEQIIFDPNGMFHTMSAWLALEETEI